jgi:hypothetical protein
MAEMRINSEGSSGDPIIIDQETIPHPEVAHMTETPRVSELDLDSQESGLKGYRFRHFKSPVLMSVLFCIGVILSCAHCIFYSRLNDHIVGSANKQERNTRQATFSFMKIGETAVEILRTHLTDSFLHYRLGTAFAFISQISFAASIWIAYTQWLWITLQGTEASLSCLNAAFSADSSVFSLMNVEMIKKFKIGSSMAALAYVLILPSFFTPATLSIFLSMNVVETEQQVGSLAITDDSFGDQFAFSPPMRSDEANFVDDGSVFTGPRSVLSLISSATSFGKILPIKAPYNHSAYSIQFYGPIVQCDPATSQITDLIAREVEKKMEEPLFTAKALINVFYAFVPTFDSSGDLIAQSRPRLQSPSNATNELWMKFSRYALDEDKGRILESKYQRCALRNASYNLQLEWIGSAQTVRGSYLALEEIPFPHDNGESISNMSAQAYSAVFWALTDQLVGQLTWFREEDTWKKDLSPEFGVIDSPIQHTSLLGSSDLDYFFDLNKNNSWYPRQGRPELTPQRRQDKNLARNRTLPVLIEELSFNLTVSLLHNELLT